MGLTAPLDIGSEKMVMALGSEERDVVRLTGIKILASQGMERGVVRDWEKVKTCVNSLMTELLKDREVEVMNVCLSGEVLYMGEYRVKVNLQKRVVEPGDLIRAGQRCREIAGNGREEELVDMIPVAYAVDRGELVADPLGRTGRELEVTYQVYKADAGYLSQMLRLFDGRGIGEVCFYPAVRAYGEALDAARAGNMALIDLGAMGINVVLFRDGLLEYEARLPLGVRTIDSDIMLAFGVNASQARKLKHEYGQAVRSACKNKKIQIPDTNLTLESRDLATVVQSRAEELLEGAVYLLQTWGYDRPEDKIVLTGGGSRLEGIDTLLCRLSGHSVERAVVRRIQTSREEVLRTPEYMVALGLLRCSDSENGEERPGIGKKLAAGLKGIFGI